MGITNKLNNTTALNLAGSWDAGGIPDSTKVASWNLANASAIGGALTAGCLRTTGALGSPWTAQINATSTSALTITATAPDAGYVGYGIKGEATGAGNYGTFGLSCPVVVNNAQIWSTVAGGITIGSGLSGAGKITLDLGGVLNTYGGAASFANTTHMGTIELQRGPLLAGSATPTTPWGAATNTIFATGTGGSIFIGGNAVAGKFANNIELTASELQMGDWAGSNNCTYNGSLALGSVTRTLNVVQGGAILAGAITGTAGFTKSGAGALTITNASPAFTTTPATPVSVQTGGMSLIPATALGAARDFSISAGTGINQYYQADTPLAANTVFSGSGILLCVRSSATDFATGITYPSGALASLTGNTDPTGTTPGTGATTGFGMYADSNANTRTSRATVSDLARRVAWWCNPGGTSLPATVELKYAGSGGTITTDFDFIVNYNQAIATSVNSFYNNATSAPLVIDGGIKRWGLSTGATFTLRGTSAYDGTIQGIITDNSLGALAIAKADAGKWILSGANTYSGATTISAGTLGAHSSNALGDAAGAVTISNGATLEISGNVSISKTTTATTINDGGVGNLGAIRSISGNNSFSNQAGFTLATSPVIIGVDADSLALTGAIAGSSIALTKVGNAELILSSSASTYNGIVTISSGTLTATKLSNSGITSSLGQGTSTVLTGTLKYIGTGDTTNRPITLATGTPSLDASGTGAVTFSAILPATGSKTLILNGTNTSDNKISTVLSNPSGGTLDLTKNGVGKWVISSNPTYTGTTTINNGTLQFSGSTDFTIQGNLVINGGTLDSDGIKLLTSVTASGGTLTSVITGSNSLLINGIATIAPVNGTNYYNGTTNISTIGNAQLSCSVNPAISGQGKMFGDSTVIVSGSLSTSRNLIQLGRARYNGDVTFAAGSSLLIGNFL